MTIPDLFILLSKAAQGIAELNQNHKKLESQNAAIIQMLRHLMNKNRNYRHELAAAKREVKNLHQLLDHEVSDIKYLVNQKPGVKKQK